ncbi:MAG TPA: M28 family peptidase [Propionibacteriaceae bacterium]|nr:M28 family peptidase [Propionibacteriaceae bacterium]
MKNRRKRRLPVIAAATLMALSQSSAAQADNGSDTGALRTAVTAKSIQSHLKALQSAADLNGGNRAAGTPGYEASATYIEQQLTAAGYAPVRQRFSYDQFLVSSATLTETAPEAVSFVNETDFFTMSYSGSGDTTAPVRAVDINLAGDRASTSGCEAADFAGFAAGSIALIQRGTCTFRLKVDNAAAAGAVGVIVFNQGNDVPGDDRFGLFAGTLDPPQAAVPAVSTTFAIGSRLAGVTGLRMRLAVDATLKTIDTFNILADTAGRADRTVIVGSHLDSVSEGPGINDNGSGSGTVLETAIQLARKGIAPVNRVRFAFWGGEEDGLIGSDFYVSQLTSAQIKQHAVNLNFDMVASPNPVRFVYDGDGSSFGAAGPNGSARAEQIFLDYFASQGLRTAPTEFDGRSDYFGFIENGIPAGGLFTGAEGIKTASEAAIFGGTAGQPYDPCYHAACDTVSNINKVVLEQMADAVAHATLTFAQTTSAVNGTAQAADSSTTNLAFRGSRALR